MSVRAIRGATTLQSDSIAEMNEAVCEMLSEIFASNEISHDDLISMIFTSTPDLVSTFPATAARTMGLSDIPLMCAVEIAVEGALARTVRVLVSVNSEKKLSEIKHVYLREASALRSDLTK